MSNENLPRHSNRKKTASSNMHSRRQFLQKLGIGASVALTGGALYLASRGSEQSDISVNPDSDMATILQEVSDLQPDIQEQQLWQNAYQRNIRPLPLNQETAPIIGNNINQTLENMANSKNAYFNEASADIMALSQQGFLTLSVEGSSPGNEFAFVYSEIANDRIQYVLAVDGNAVLNNTNGLLLALALTHEHRHIQDKINFQSSLPANLPLEQRLSQQIQQRQQDPVGDEVGAYADQSEALIQTLLFGVNTEIPTNIIHIAAQYIRTGKNEHSIDWKNFINNHIHN